MTLRGRLRPWILAVNRRHHRENYLSTHRTSEFSTATGIDVMVQPINHPTFHGLPRIDLDQDKGRAAQLLHREIHHLQLKPHQFLHQHHPHALQHIRIGRTASGLGHGISQRRQRFAQQGQTHR